MSSYSRYMDRSLDDFPPESHRGGGDRSSRDHGDKHHSQKQHRSDKHLGGSSSKHHGGDHDDMPHIDGEADDRTLFVANLNYSTSWQELRDHLRKAGTIEKCDIFKDSHGYSKGFGLVVFGETDAMDRAIQDYNDSVLNDRNMKLRKSRPTRDKKVLQEYQREGGDRRGHRKHSSRDPACSVFVHNLDYNVTWQKLKDIFKVVGRVVDVEVLEERRGAAVVQLSTSDEAIKAIALFHGQMLMDRPMQLRMDSRSPYQPDPLKLKLSALKSSMMSSSSREHREHPSSRRHRHSRHEVVGGSKHHYEGRSHRPRPRSRSPLSPPPRRPRDYSYSPPPPRGYSRRDEGYYPPLEREEYYSRSHRSYPDRHGYDKGRYDMRSPSYSSSSSSGSSLSHSPSPPPRSRRISPRRVSPRRISPRRISPRRISPRRVSPRRVSPRRVSPHRVSRPRSVSYSPDLRDDLTITSVFVKNLPFRTTWQGLKDEFRKVGLVKRAEIKPNKDGRPSGLALIWYGTHDEANNAVAMFDETVFDGRQISVQLNKMQHRQQQQQQQQQRY